MSTLEAKELAVIEPETLVFLKTETVLSFTFVTTTSGLPSPSISPNAISFGSTPVVKSTLGANEIVPEEHKFLETEKVLLEKSSTTKSGLPSPSMSLMATRIGYAPVIIRSTFEAKELAVIDPRELVFLKIEIGPLILFATTKSGLPSPSKSAIAAEIGPVPVVKSTLGAKELVVIEPEELVFLKIETVLLASFVTTKSGLPSPSTSPTAILFGLFPVVKLTAGAKELP